MENKIINTVEALLLGAGRPMKLSEIRSILEASGILVELSDIKRAINDLEARHSGSSIEVVEVSSGYRLKVKDDFSESLSHLWSEKNTRLSKALLEIISIIAYKQPVTRGDIEEIRGVHVSTNSIRSLLEREWIQVSGFRDTPGRPALYKTTKKFLDDLNLKNISMLPKLPEVIQEKDLYSEVV